MKRYGVLSALGAALFMCAWLISGIERIEREHATEYNFFFKQSLGLQVMFVNTVACGECDVAPLESLSKVRLDQFSQFCQARFGLAEVRPCYAIFREQQAMVNERIGAAVPRP